ncbi:hypothetical protein FACS189481_5390 [Clostridia bacterium]|nr:hypothetical protein FACS189481_5390 [Clostridia bacterium]
MEKVLVDGEEYVPTDLKDTGDTITFTWPPAGKSITHDPNMYADFKRKKRPAQISGIPSP